MAEFVYLNGSLLPHSQAHISVSDHGFLYGYGLFETMRAYHGKIFLLERHLNRLLSAAQVLGLGSRLNAAELGKACLDILAANGLKNARLRLTVTRGEVNSFPGPGVSNNPTILVTANAYSPPPPESYNKGFRAGIASFPTYSQSSLLGLKSTNYLFNIKTKLETEAAGLDESLLLNEHGLVTEGSISNVFLVTPASGLVTPAVASGLLPGITRQVAMELADSSGINAVESEVKLADLKQFKEAFLTNSLMEIMPLVEVRDNTGKVISIGLGSPGPVTRKLIAAYREMVEQHTSR
ncbi:MAG: branched-chain amino acid aminotransferase [Dehalococcoidales bacterium]|jgi:branched-subunit amino acid aminotransferase/4-amino-4-deoxychorismate lyase|nr:branched-chain amino acid aminotransferase [Dehalococcoidales bacterium]|tara:strand:- start:331 stop:1215 length:885 start_codon:yes stop_codon:yes gene_type:complete